MAKIFRKFRFSAISGERVAKYLMYAAGEILLVVAGILIALSVNNWNQDRKDRKREAQILKNIRKEIIENNRVNKELISHRLSGKIEGLKLAKAYAENQLQVVDTTKFLASVSYGAVFSGGYSYGFTNFFDELLSTGELGLIQADTVRNIITDYYSRLSIFEKRSEVHSSNYLKYINELRPFDALNSEVISAYDRNEMMITFKSPEFRKEVDMEISYAFKVRDYINNTERRANRALELIQKVLDQE